jgi:Domain of unknown function (DUF4307)
LYVSANDLNARYGRTTSRRRRNIIIAICFGVGVLVVFAAWAIWVGLFQPSVGLDYADVGQTAAGPDKLDVKWQLSVAAGTPTKCAIQALDANFGIVGWKIVSLPASDAPSRRFSTIVRTAQPAVSGNIYQCWIPDDK